MATVQSNSVHGWFGEVRSATHARFGLLLMVGQLFLIMTSLVFIKAACGGRVVWFRDVNPRQIVGWWDFGIPIILLIAGSAFWVMPKLAIAKVALPAALVSVATIIVKQHFMLDNSVATMVLLATPIFFAAFVFATPFAWLVWAYMTIFHMVMLAATPELRTSLPLWVAVYGVTAAVLRVVTMVREKHQQGHRELMRLASTDATTGLWNQRHLAKEIEESCDGTLVLVDVDHFQGINDAYGHPFGDAILRMLADILTAQAHDGDVVARVGGDELAVFLCGVDAEEAISFAHEVVSTVNSARIEAPGGDEIVLTVSVGLASCCQETVSYDRIVNDARSAVTEAKKRGRNTAHKAQQPALTART